MEILKIYKWIVRKKIPESGKFNLIVAHKKTLINKFLCENWRKKFLQRYQFEP